MSDSNGISVCFPVAPDDVANSSGVIAISSAPSFNGGEGYGRIDNEDVLRGCEHGNWREVPERIVMRQLLVELRSDDLRRGRRTEQRVAVRQCMGNDSGPDRPARTRAVVYHKLFAWQLAHFRSENPAHRINR